MFIADEERGEETNVACAVIVCLCGSRFPDPSSVQWDEDGKKKQKQLKWNNWFYLFIKILVD